MPALPPAYRAIILDQQDQLQRLVRSAGIAPVRALYDRMLEDVTRRIRATAAGTFSHQQLTGLLAQIKLGLARLQAPLGDAVERGAATVGVHAARTLLQDAAKLERHFSGAVISLPLLESARLRGLVDGQVSSLMRVHATSMARFGTQLVGRMEEEIGASISMGDPQTRTIDRIMTVGQMQWHRAERIVRCLPGDTVVTGGVVRAVHRRWHQGTMVQVVTENGGKLTATTNHPVLTSRGWVGAGSLQHGDYLVRHLVNERAGASRHEDVTRRPATVREVFDATATVGVIERRRGAHPDFHGDGGDGDVDVAVPDRELMYGIFVPLAKPASQQLLSPADVLASGLRFCPRCTGLLPHERACRCLGADLDASALEALVQQAVMQAERRRYLGDRFARGVSRDHLVDRRRDLIRGSVAPHQAGAMGIMEIAHYAGILDVLPDTGSGDAELGADLPRAEPGLIQADRVIDLRLFEFSGHVFNITSADGYFYANGYIVGNTELSFAAGRSARMAADEQAAELDGDMWSRWTEHVTDEGTPLDDRVGVDSEAMHGQVAPPGEPFTQPPTNRQGDEVSDSLVGREWTSPPNRPNDRAVLVPWRASWGVPGWRWEGGRRVPVTEAAAQRQNERWMRSRGSPAEISTDEEGSPQPPPAVGFQSPTVEDDTAAGAADQAAPPPAVPPPIGFVSPAMAPEISPDEIPAIPAGEIPEHGDLTTPGRTQAADPQAIADHGWYEPAGYEADLERAERAYEEVADGLEQPVQIGVTPRRNLVVSDAADAARLNAAADLDERIPVQWHQADGVPQGHVPKAGDDGQDPGLGIRIGEGRIRGAEPGDEVAPTSALAPSRPRITEAQIEEADWEIKLRMAQEQLAREEAARAEAEANRPRGTTMVWRPGDENRRRQVVFEQAKGPRTAEEWAAYDREQARKRREADDRAEARNRAARAAAEAAGRAVSVDRDPLPEVPRPGLFARIAKAFEDENPIAILERQRRQVPKAKAQGPSAISRLAGKLRAAGRRLIGR